jgi:hypothetical protein
MVFTEVVEMFLIIQDQLHRDFLILFFGFGAE